MYLTSMEGFCSPVGLETDSRCGWPDVASATPCPCVASRSAYPDGSRLDAESARAACSVHAGHSALGHGRSLPLARNHVVDPEQHAGALGRGGDNLLFDAHGLYDVLREHVANTCPENVDAAPFLIVAVLLSERDLDVELVETGVRGKRERNRLQCFGVLLGGELLSAFQSPGPLHQAI